jgi:hypothetical protein
LRNERGRRNFPKLEEVTLPLKWLPGSDGEIIHGQLLNRIIGLFEVPRFNAVLAAGQHEVFPWKMHSPR